MNVSCDKVEWTRSKEYFQWLLAGVLGTFSGAALVLGDSLIIVVRHVPLVLIASSCIVHAASARMSGD